MHALRRRHGLVVRRPEHLERAEVEDCVRVTTPECRCATAGGCGGPLVAKNYTCVAHALAFGLWLTKHGGNEVYLSTKTRGEKRFRFLLWLQEHPELARAPWLAATVRVRPEVAR